MRVYSFIHDWFYYPFHPWICFTWSFFTHTPIWCLKRAHLNTHIAMRIIIILSVLSVCCIPCALHVYSTNLRTYKPKPMIQNGDNWDGFQYTLFFMFYHLFTSNIKLIIHSCFDVFASNIITIGRGFLWCRLCCHWRQGWCRGKFRCSDFLCLYILYRLYFLHAIYFNILYL